MFNGTHNVPQYCDANDNWIGMKPAPVLNPASCPDIADRCNDGTIYVGTLDYGFGAENIYLYDKDYGGAWKNSFGEIDLVPNSTQDGRANVMNLKDDISNYPAFQTCHNLEASGHDDWYLPASDELMLLRASYSAINAISNSSLGSQYYWASTENSASDGRLHRLSNTQNAGNRKNINFYRYRCIRRENIQYTQIVPDGLIGHWRLDETSGTTAYDSSGNENHGTYKYAVTNSNNEIGQVSRALDFEGTDGYANIPYDLSLHIPTDFTISAWVRPEDTDTSTFGDPIFHNTRGGGSEDGIYVSWKWQATNGRFCIVSIASDDWNYSEDFSCGLAQFDNSKWYFVMIIRSLGINFLYVNNELYHTFTTDFSDSQVNPFRIGGWHTSRYFDGLIDDVRIYDRVLSEDEMRQLYRATDGIRYNGDFRRYEYFDGNRFVSMTPDWGEVDEGPIYDCGSPGDLCGDGSYYVGPSPDGNAPMFATSVAHESTQSWNNDTTNWFRTYFNDNNDGQSNTNSLATASDIGAPYNAATYCYNLSAHGYDDWYLPAQEELRLFYDGGPVISDLDTSGAKHWSSTELNNNEGDNRAQHFRLDNQVMGSTGDNKDDDNLVRCVRKGNLTITGTGGLALHMKMDEAVGTTMVDAVNGITFNIENTHADTALTRGPVGNAFDFLQPDARLYAVDPAVQPLQSIFADGGSISLWVNPVEGDDVFLNLLGFNIRHRTGASDELGFWFSKSFSGGTAQWRTSDTTPDIPYNDWSHLVLVYNQDDTANDPILYINGIEASPLPETTAPSGAATMSADGRIAIGAGLSGTGPIEGMIDDLRMYNRALSASEITKLYQMGTPVGSSTALPQGCPNIGDVCDDGSIYAGLSADGSVEMFVSTYQAENPSVAYNNGNSSGYTVTGLLNGDTGEDNTNAAVTIDSDSDTDGFQTHLAAQYCYDLVSSGADDWYLPASNELDLALTSLHTGQHDVHYFDIDGGVYWTSNVGGGEDTNPDKGNRRLIRSDGSIGVGWRPKHATNTRARCVRKGPAPRCADPYGVEGQMVYNTDHDVVQFCDGARWIGIGKYSP
ncbi:LamG-like jellyroll fold domain-containing protein [Roseovarius sp. D22-M7]|uniref:LamG-like jellyroll fold domain-containing protein n=1 Tax=Roseovarius sp. D22-M7 TaxID=3127116 RepID=UPI00300FF312